MDRSAISVALQLVGRELSSSGWKALARLYDWLGSEAKEAGGIGPSELSRLEARHLADSVLFALPWKNGRVPATLLDIGTGAGLPGLVLAIVFPDTQLTLLDRSQKRIDLAARGARVVGLDNVVVLREEIREHSGQYSGVTMRAALPPLEAIPVVAAAISPSGTGVLALSRASRPASPDRLIEVAEESGCLAKVVEQRVLDLPSWLLIMTRS